MRNVAFELGRSARVALGAMWLAAAAVAVAEPPGLVLRYTFDDTLTPVVGADLGAPRSGGKPQFVEGRFGKAVALTDGAHLILPLPPAVRNGEFSICLWLRPLWHPKDGLPHPILEIPAKPEKEDAVKWAPGQLFVSKGWSEAIAPDHFYGVVDSDVAKRHLKPNQWTHLALVFSQSGKFTGSYVDGEGSRRLEKTVTPLDAHGDVMWVGARAGGAGFGDVVIDELRVYDRPLAPEELPAVAGTTFPPPFDYLSIGNACDPAKAVATPHTAWARPLSGGPVRAVVVTEGRRAREAIELAQRLEVEPTVITCPTFYPHLMVNKEIFAAAGQRLEAALKAGRVDVVVVAAFGWNLLPDATRTAVLQYVRAGGGLLFVDPRCLSSEPGNGLIRNMGAGIRTGWEDAPAGREIEALVSRLDRADEEFLTQAIPWQAVSLFAPTLVTRAVPSLFRGGRVDKGRVLVYDLPTGGVYSTACLTPNLAHSRETDFSVLEYDYAVGAAARAVLWAAGRDSAVRILRVTCRPAREMGPAVSVGTVVRWTVDVQNSRAEKVTAQVRLTARTRGPDAPFEAARDIGLVPGLNRVTVDQTLTGVGEVFGDARLLLDGKVADWSTAVVTASRGNPWIAAIATDRAAYPHGRASPAIRAQLGLTKYRVAAGETGEVRWRLFDAYGRLVSCGTQAVVFSPYDENLTPVEWRLDPPGDACFAYTLAVDLAYRGKVTDQQSLALRCPQPEVDDYILTSWQGGGTAVDCLAAIVMRDQYGLGCGGYSPLGRPVDAASLTPALDWLSRQNIRPWLYATHLGSRVDADKVRMPDLADPEYLTSLRERLAGMAAIAEPYSPLYYSLGDETALGPYDARATGYEQEAFRLHLQQRYRTIEELNKAWGSSYKAWPEIVIPPPEDLAAGKAGALGSDLAPFREGLYAGAIAAGTDGVRGVAAQARCGVEGIFGLTQAWTGQDYWKMTRASTFMGMYACGMEMNMVRSFQKPGDLLGAWWNYAMLDPDYSRFGPWHILLRGAQTFMWYTTLEGSQYTALNPDFTPFRQFQWTNEELQPLLAGIGKLVLGLQRDDLGVVVLHNQLNLDRCGPQFHSMMMMTRMLDDLGIQHDFVHGDQVAAGELLRRRATVLLLPGQFSMSTAVADAIRAFVAAGGAVLADVLPAESTGTRRYDKRLLDDLFADSAALKGALPPVSAADVAAWKTHEKTVGKGRTLLFGGYPASYGRDRYKEPGRFMREAVGAFLSDVGVRRAATVQPVAGAFQPLTVVTYHDGPALYVGLQRDYAVPDPAAREFEIAVPAKAHAYAVVSGKYLGETDRPRISLELARGALLAFLPYQAAGVAIGGLDEVCFQGERRTLRLALNSVGGAPVRGVFRVETVAPTGQVVKPLCAKIRWTGGLADMPFAVAYNDPVGKWTLRVTDIATGITGERAFEVKLAPGK